MVHGGAFILGHSGMVSPDHVTDCLSRGWIVVAPEHRLCPHVDIYEGPIADTRDCLAWVYDGGLQKSVNECGKADAKGIVVNSGKVAAMGMSSGGTCALAMVCTDSAFLCPVPVPHSLIHCSQISNKRAGFLDQPQARCNSRLLWRDQL